MVDLVVEPVVSVPDHQRLVVLVYLPSAIRVEPLDLFLVVEVVVRLPLEATDRQVMEVTVERVVLIPLLDLR
jgi:hypothetical protein